ncbi:MAG: hypothetical protein NVSMB19_10740 [Vulcanimicrobiaceae bacterium]
MTGALRAWAALVAFALALPLVGASGFAAPVVVVYPITSGAALDSAAGGNLALIVATKLSELGGITIKPSAPGTERAKFLEAALASGADYYITGFLTPIGADSSLITQVVSTHSGSVVFSTTGVVRTYADALAQVDPLRVAILRHAGRGLAALDAPPPAPRSSPAPAANDGSVDIGKALRKRKRATLAPAAGDRAGPGSALLFAIGGALSADEAAQATRAILEGFARVNRPTALLGVPVGANLERAAAICGATPGTRDLDTANVAIGRSESGDARIQLDLTAYDCAGTLLRTQRANATASGRNGVGDAIARAATAATRALGTR